MNQTVHLPKLVAAILACEAVGIATGLATYKSIEEWYPTINKPAWTPPNAVFGPVWTLLFGMMGVARHLVGQAEDTDSGVVRLAKTCFAIQLGLNALWSLLFFGRRSPLAGMIEIVFLWLAILATVLTFWRVSRLAAVLLLPYLLWVSYAMALNVEIWRLNR